MSQDRKPVVTAPEDCGNSPRKLLLKDLNIAYAHANTNKILSAFADDIVWEIYGERQCRGIEEVEQYITQFEAQTIETYVVETIITHGKDASVNGKMSVDGAELAFCDVYAFSSVSKDAKINRIESYVVGLREN